ncbi:DUF2269 family protein [Paenibacillus lactis]|uniref:DUF2269 family protein n=1 Tax=Paenibacillus lactis TaxID=228574 RepID=UPI00367C0F38
MAYTIILIIHVISAIAMIGPAFYLQRFLAFPKASAGSAGSLRYAHGTARRLDRLTDTGMILQLVTGLLMGWMEPVLFQMLWYDAALVLVPVIGLYMKFAARPRIRSLYALVESATVSQADLERTYRRLWSQALPHILIVQGGIGILILLMVLKP